MNKSLPVDSGYEILMLSFLLYMELLASVKTTATITIINMIVSTVRYNLTIATLQ